jgi:hypothetical protein
MRLARRSSRSHPPGTLDHRPLERLSHSQRAARKSSQIDHRRLVPVTIISTRRLPHREHTSRSRQSRTVVQAPCRRRARRGRVRPDAGIPGTTRSAARPPPSVGGGPSSNLLLRHPARSLRRRSLANHTAPGHSTRPASCQTRVQAALYRSAQESRELEPRVSSR